MKYFAEAIINPYIRESGYRTLCELGADLGGNTDRLLATPGSEITIVDPCLSVDLCAKYEGDPRVHVRKGLSLEVLPDLKGPFDCIMVDGDHNWYTVYNELRLIDERDLLSPGGTLLLHDVCWPYARRDMYYQPETVPEAFRQPHARRGIVHGRSELAVEGGANADLYNAEHEGGPRNGVLTAAEDFLREHPGRYTFFALERQFGLGFIVRDPPGPVAERYRRKTARANALGPLRRLIRRKDPNRGLG